VENNNITDHPGEIRARYVANTSPEFKYAPCSLKLFQPVTDLRNTCCNVLLSVLEVLNHQQELRRKRAVIRLCKGTTFIMSLYKHVID
jgi:hypothetical protein